MNEPKTIITTGPLKVVCAWCKTTMREGIEPVTHGICDTCLQKFEAIDDEARP